MKICMKGREVEVKFRSHNKKKVVCTLTFSTMLFGSTLIRIVVTENARCNYKAGDDFDLYQGRKIALDKAYEKLCRKLERLRLDAEINLSSPETAYHKVYNKYINPIMRKEKKPKNTGENNREN